MNNWIKTTVGEFSPFVYGKGLSKNSRGDGMIPVFGSNGRIGTHNQAIAKPHTIIIGRKGTIGAVHFSKSPCWAIDTTYFIEPSKNRDASFTYYLLKSLKLDELNSDTAVPGLNRDFAHSIPVEIPSLEEQEKIGYILRVLDDKIELVENLNKTLEKMIRSIFKSWFIDFEFPNEQGKPYRSSGGVMIDSEMGEIPKGWKIVDLASQINIKHGYAFKGEYFKDVVTEFILLTPGNFSVGGGYQDDKIKYYDGPVKEEYVLSGGELLVTMTDLSKMGDTLGYPAFVPLHHKKKFLHNQRLGKILIKPASYLSLQFLYCMMCTSEYRYEILGCATGSTVKHTSPERIMNHKFALPVKELLTKFEHLAKLIFHLINSLKREENTLQTIRDTLLPKLMSGEIRV